MNTFFTSDTHFHHKNIVAGTSEWDDKRECRDFDTLEEHNAKLVQNINALVKPNDILYHLGDWSFGGVERIWEFRKQLHCKNIHLILGNHDHHIENNKNIVMTAADCDRAVELGILDGIHGYVNGEPSYAKLIGSCWTSIKMELDHETTYKLPIQMMFKSVNQTLFRKINGKTMFLSHYAHRVWRDGNHGTIHLYGHSHGTLPEYSSPFQLHQTPVYYRCMDVGVDTHPEFRPYHFDEIIKEMSFRFPLQVDHHNEKSGR